MTSRDHVLTEARQAVMKDRNAEYAPPEQNFQRIADLWNTYLENRTIAPFDVAIMCGLIKVARCISSPHQVDHLVDLAGYAACAGDVMPVPPGEPTAATAEPIPVVLSRRVRFEGEEGELKVAYPKPGINTFYADGGRKVPLTPEQVERGEAEGVLVFEDSDE